MEYTEGLQFTLNETQDGYSVRHGSDTDKDIIIPSEYNGLPVIDIGYYAFFNCHLTSVVIPSSIINIGENAFDGNQLTELTIPDSVTSISYCAFAGNQLTSLVIPGNLVNTGEGAFSHNQISELVIRNGVINIGNSAFSNNQLTSVIVPNSVTSVGNGAFNANSNLSTIKIGSGILDLGDHTFAQDYLLEEIYINSVEAPTIYQYTFDPVIPLKIYIPANANLESYKTGYWEHFYNKGQILIQPPSPFKQLGDIYFNIESNNINKFELVPSEFIEDLKSNMVEPEQNTLYISNQSNYATKQDIEEAIYGILDMEV